jgi:hypothetical protein
LADEYGLEYLGFLSLTFSAADELGRPKSIKEAQRRFHSLMNWLALQFRGGIVVWELHKDGTIHFHALVVCDEDIRTGFDFEEVGNRDYRSVSHWLRAMWATLRVRLPEFHFGRHELKPVRTNGEGVGRYLGNYIVKHYDSRLPEDRGARIVRFFGCARTGRRMFASGPKAFKWATENAVKFQLGVTVLARSVGLTRTGLKTFVTELLGEKAGPRWAYVLRGTIWRMGVQEWMEPGRW